MTTRGARLIVVGVALIAAFAAGRASAATPAPPVHVTAWTTVNVGPYAPVRIASPRGSALPVTEPTPAPSGVSSAPVDATRHRAGAFVRGTATWYCAPGVSRCTRGHPADCLCAAISPDLRYLGPRLRVCAGERCVTVRVIDCDCQAHHSIDLYAAAFVRLASPSAGRLRVTISAWP